MADWTSAQVAERLGLTQRRIVELLGDRRIAGRQMSDGTWLIDSDSVLRYENAHRGHAGREMSPASAWGLLWALSEKPAPWLAPHTKSRIRNRLAHQDAEGLARAVATRTRAHRYRSANTERIIPDVIATGRLALSLFAQVAPPTAGLRDLVGDSRRVAGYVPVGETMENFARTHFMRADTGGQDVLYENTLPIEYKSEVMPIAVIAADLALSIDARERSAGLIALDDLRNKWLAQHTT